MDYKLVMDDILKAAAGSLEEAEVYISTNENLSIQSFQGEISKYEIAESGGLSLRGIYNGKMGYAYTEKIDSYEAENLIKGVIDNSKYLEGDREYILEASKEYEDFKGLYLDRNSMSIENKLENILKIEARTKELDKRVTEVMVSYSESSGKTFIKNTKGVDLEDDYSIAVLYTSVYAKENNEVKTGSASRKLFNLDELVDHEKICRDAVEDAVGKLGASTVKSGNYKTIIEKDAFASLLAAFSSIFIAELVQKDLSLLKGKLGEKIASDKLNIVDNPFLEEGLGSGNFDAEASKTELTQLVKDGVLKNYLYNIKTASKDGVRTTGNASRGYKSSLGTSPTNFYVENGDKSFDELVVLCEDGILIDDLQGLHSGLNTVSGDFSLSAGGFLIKDSKIDRPVNQITIAGNFFELLENIEEVGSDLHFGIINGNIASPSIYIKELAVSGE